MNPRQLKNHDLEPNRTGEQNGQTVDEANQLNQQTSEKLSSPVNPGANNAPELTSRSPKRRILVIMGAIALMVGALVGWRWWQFQQTHVSTENAQIQGHLSPISAKVPGTIQQVLVKNGDSVTAGQPLIILEDPDLALKVQQAEAKLAVAQAQLQSATDTLPLTQQTNTTQVQQSKAKLAANQSAIAAAQANIAQTQARIETNQAKVAQAQAEVNKTQADFRRYEALYREGTISAQQFDAARTAYESAQASLAAAQRTVAQSQAELRSTQAQLQKTEAEAEAAQGQVAETQASGQTVVVQKDQEQLARSQVKQAQAELALARQQLAYTVIKAPVSGSVGELTAQVGQKVETGQALLAVVPLQIDQVYVEANFKETALGKLRLGQLAEVEVDAYPGEIFHARIAGISPATGAKFALIPPDNATGNFNKVVQWVPVRLVFAPDNDPQHKLRPGLNLRVIVDTHSTPTTASTQP